jgi:tRNA(Glu) U13 pseudouridine synthase TruD
MRNEYGANYEVYWPNDIKCNGFIDKNPDNFIVKETFGDIIINCNNPSRNIRFGMGHKYLYLTLVKRGISTFDCVNAIADMLNINKSAITYCGLKDTLATATQRISIDLSVYKKSTISFEGANKSSFYLCNPELSDTPLHVGQHTGNNFTIKVNTTNPEATLRKMSQLIRKLKTNKIPNFYGPQRFGPNRSNHEIGKEIIKGNFKKAAEMWLSSQNILYADSSTTINATQIATFKSNVQMYGDYAAAFEAIDLGPFFIRAYHSYLFNKVLASIIGTIQLEKLETVGFDTKFSTETELIYNEVLDDENIAISEFNLPNHPKLSIRGGYRNTMFVPQNLGLKANRDSVTLSFTLPKAAYASVFLGFILKDNSKFDWI